MDLSRSKAQMVQEVNSLTTSLKDKFKKLRSPNNSDNNLTRSDSAPPSPSASSTSSETDEEQFNRMQDLLWDDQWEQEVVQQKKKNQLRKPLPALPPTPTQEQPNLIEF